MSKEYKRDETKSMVEKVVVISTNNENCEGDNWTDAINLCGEADLLIMQYETKIATIEAELAEHEWVSVEDPPKQDGFYLVVVANEDWRECYYDKGLGFRGDEVTHWKRITLPR